MIGAYMPQSVVKLITGMDFAMLSFSFIPIEDIPLASQLSRWFSYAQQNDYYSEIGLNSGSAIVNHLQLLVISGLIVLVHVCIVPCYKYSIKYDSNRCLKW